MIYDFIELHPKTSVPMCTQIYQEIQAAITKGKFLPHEKMPSIRRAALELGVSRTTIETAYLRLCSAGYLYSKAQSGYYVEETVEKSSTSQPVQKAKKNPIRYDFTSSKIDEKAADTSRWKKYLRAALQEETDLLSYGDPQGEASLREAIASYSFRARGVMAHAENILVGAGTQFLLSLFCSLYDQKGVIAMDAPGFKQAERIFKDYGFAVAFVDVQDNTSLLEQLERCKASLYLDIPANHPQKANAFMRRKRQELWQWVHEKENRFILEDDYNGELCYTKRPNPAMQGIAPNHVVYLGSFSKLLLPSFRIAYMVLPEAFLPSYQARKQDYNATAGKMEQLALSNYIEDGLLEKHLRKLKKLYFEKSTYLFGLLKEYLPLKRISILETSLSIMIHLEGNFADDMLEKKLKENGVAVDFIQKNHLRLSFSGMPREDFLPAVLAIQKAIESH